ncbi:MAG: matrixin family metalloprotease [Myxococcota bacterium]
MRRALLLAALACVLPSPAKAFECIGSGSSCPRWCSDTVPFGISVTSVDLPEETVVSETRRGLEDWSRRTCTGLATNYTGRSSAVAGERDGNSIVGWVESGWARSRAAIGVASPRWTTDPRTGESCIFEADIVMNGEHFTWVTEPGSGDRVNTYSIALHEGGHYLGLDHSDDGGAVMFFQYRGGVSAIGSDDEAGICFLYPGDGGAVTDCTTSGCPAGQECVDRVCQVPVGDGGVCARCATNADCGGSTDACLVYPDGVGYCGQGCNSSADCGDDVCARLSSGILQCLRVQDGTPDCSGAAPGPECTINVDCDADEICEGGSCVPRPPDRAGLGEGCTSGDECASGVCSLGAGGVCTQLCDGFDVTSCPAGFFCDGDASGSCGEGLCLAGSAGDGTIGTACSLDTDCATLMCDAGLCASPCQPDGAAVCAPGFTCQPSLLVGCGACKPDASLGAIGAACESGADCASGECARRGDRTFCTAFCDDENPCPVGFECLSLGDFALCIPPEAPGEDAGVGVDAGAGTDGSMDDPAVRRLQGGCGCRVQSGAPGRRTVAFVSLAVLVLVFRRRRR